jgi:hypothetical protein
VKNGSFDYVKDLPPQGLKVLQWASGRWDAQAAIAGGAVRECLLGRPELIKDVDVWVNIETGLTGAPGEPTETEAVLGSLGRYMDGLGIEWRHVITLTAESPDIRWIIKLIVDGVDVDILNTTRKNGEDCRHLVESFDYGICMCAVNMNGVWTHELFHEDVHHQTCTYHATNRECESIRRSIKDHLPRILEKYPNFKANEIPEIEDAVNVDIPWVRKGGCGY